jgi:transcriptional regulator with XRE-family HTH domain
MEPYYSALETSGMLARKKRPNPTDTHVGYRVRMRRLMLDMSQTKLADALGLTFQQVQKYEKGTNRIGASRLLSISQNLRVPVSFFFEGAPRLSGPGIKNGAPPSPSYLRATSSPLRMDSPSPRHS